MPSHCTLQHLVQPWLNTLEFSLGELSVSELVLDSRQVRDGSTFVAIKGHAVDGRQFIDTAVEAGANLVLAQSDAQHCHGQVQWAGRGSVQAPVLYLDDLPLHLSALAGRLYIHQPMQLIAVTGTNGKTTITQLIAQWMELLDTRAAVMGTTGNGFLDELEEAKNTTGSAIEIQQTLSRLSERGAEYTALETSSHGLVQHRIQAIKFAAGVFTNLSRDHLDYHGTMEEYEQAKLSLFTDHCCQHKVINTDDPVGERWLGLIADATAVSIHGQPCGLGKALYATDIRYSPEGIRIHIDGSWGPAELTVPLIGDFNASNLLLAMATLLNLGFDLQALVTSADKLRPVIGRMELFHNTDKAQVVVDYAHTPDALQKALCALRVHCEGKLWAILGCGGDRDKGKRPMMAAIGERFADAAILTDDNPRTEDPEQIVQDMLAGVEDPGSVVVKHNRFDALAYALSHATPQDIILFAGKGHEEYQIVGDEMIHYSDRESAMNLLGLTQ